MDMSCTKFQKNMNNFINDKMLMEDIDFFVGHAKNCKECYEELEINYMVNIGLDRIEKDEKASFDLKGELEKKISQCQERSDNFYKFKVYKNIVVFTAYCCTIAVMVLSIFSFLGLF